jgi:DNA-binding response OmpR family regulator
MARVLVVEDEPNIAEIILFKLRREGHAVSHVESAVAARLAEGAWDLVILDSSLPGEDALELLGEMCVRSPVAVMTESRDLTTGDLARHAGASAVVAKPFKPTLLARLVAELVAGKGDLNHSDSGDRRELMTPMSGGVE